MAEAQIQQDAVASPGVETRSRRQDFLRAFFSNRLAIFGAAIMSVFILMAVFAPYVAPYSPLQQHLPQKFEGPTLAHPFGQDELGRDIPSRVIYGARVSLTAGLAAVGIATAILDVAALSFLGLGARAPTPEWGAMLTDAFRSGFGVFLQGQHAIIFPGIAIALAVLSVNFIGAGLRDALDPRRRR